MSVPSYTHLVVHHSAHVPRPDEDSVARIEQWHRDRGWSEIGYHWVVANFDGRWYAVQGRPMSREGAHARGWNDTAVGVCLAGNFSQEPPSEGQLDEAADLIAGLLTLADLPVECVVPHNEVPHAATECPGTLFDFDDLMRRVEERLR